MPKNKQHLRRTLSVQIKWLYIWYQYLNSRTVNFFFNWFKSAELKKRCIIKQQKLKELQLNAFSFPNQISCTVVHNIRILEFFCVGFENASLRKSSCIHEKRLLLVNPNTISAVDQTHLAHLIWFNKLYECKIQYKNYKK